MTPVTTRLLRVAFPNSPSQDLNPIVGRCDNCIDPSTCFGPRISSIVPPIEAKFAIVDDGGPGGGSFGCVSIKNDVAGTIALVRRGDCEFGLKVMNAQIAGAVGCVIMNNDPNNDFPRFSLPGGEFSKLVNIPVALLNNAEADPLEAAILAGDTLIGLIGGTESDVLVFNSVIYHDWDSDDVDPNPGNNTDSFVTRVWLYGDGFESGDTSLWTATDQ